MEDVKMKYEKMLREKEKDIKNKEKEMENVKKKYEKMLREKENLFVEEMEIIKKKISHILYNIYYHIW